MLGPDGKPLTSRGWYDTESLAEDGGTLYVGIERVNQIVRFDFAKDGLRARGRPIAVPPASKLLPHNKEHRMPGGRRRKGGPLAGTLIAISERGLDAARQSHGLPDRRPSRARLFTVKRTDDFDVSDCARLPTAISWCWSAASPGRAASRCASAACRSRRSSRARWSTAGADRRRHGLPDRQHGRPVGAPRRRRRDVLTLISDDNFSPLQRTLLLQFTLVGATTVAIAHVHERNARHKAGHDDLRSVR